MAKTQELDQELVEGLKLARTKRMYFAAVLKGGNDGALLVKKTKVPPNAIAEAKKSCGGSAVVKGFVFGEEGKLIFEVGKEPPGTMANALKIIAKRDSGLSIHPECRVSSDPELMEEESEEAASNGAPQGKTVAPEGTSTATKTPANNSVPGPLPHAEQYAAAQQTWEKASSAAIIATDKLVSSMRGIDDEVAQAIADIIEQMRNDFPDTLDDALTGLAAAAKLGKEADAEGFRNKAEIAVRAALAYLNNNAQTIEGCEQNPFGVTVSFRAPLTESLKQVLTSIKK